RAFGSFGCRRFRRLDHLARRTHHRAYLGHLVGYRLACAFRRQGALFRFLGSLLACLFFGSKTLLAFLIAAGCCSLRRVALRLLALCLFTRLGLGFLFGLQFCQMLLLLAQLCFLACNQLRLATRLFCTARTLRFINDWSSNRNLGLRSGCSNVFYRIIALDESTFLAHFHLDGA